MQAEYCVKPITYDQTKFFILEIHYAKRMPPISFAFGLYLNNFLVGVCTYGKPASQFLCKGICGEQYAQQVYELNRLALMYNHKNEASMLIGRSLKLLPPNLIIVSYADTKYNHTGYVYQATNWLYTGLTKPRTDMVGINGKHPRHYKPKTTKRVNRSPKHRYVTFTGNKRQRKTLYNHLNYKVLPYPKN